MDLLQIYWKTNVFPAQLLIAELAKVAVHVVSVKLVTPSMLNRFHQIQLWAIPLQSHHSLKFASYAMLLIVSAVLLTVFVENALLDFNLLTELVLDVIILALLVKQMVHVQLVFSLHFSLYQIAQEPVLVIQSLVVLLTVQSITRFVHHVPSILLLIQSTIHAIEHVLPHV